MGPGREPWRGAGRSPAKRFFPRFFHSKTHASLLEMGDQRSRRKPTITGTHPNTKQPPPYPPLRLVPASCRSPALDSLVSATCAHAYSRDTRRSETSAKGHFHFLHYFCAPPHAQVGHRVGAHAPTRRSVPGHPAPDSARSDTLTSTKVLHTRCQPMALVRDRAAVAVFLTLLPDATSS